MKVTIVKKYRDKETLTLIGLSEVVRKIQEKSFESVCREIRMAYPLAEVRQRLGGGRYEPSASLWLNYLPKVYFSAAMLNRNRQRVMMAYNGLVLLEVNNLGGFEEAKAVRKSASLIPQTMLAFVGSSGLSVKIVCRGELFDGGLPTSDEDIWRFHVNLYEKARLAYNMQLGVTIEKLEPELTRACYVSSDHEIVYNEFSQPFYTDCSDVNRALKPIAAGSEKQDTLLPGIDNHHAMRLIYEFCLTKAYDDVTDIGEEEGRTHLLLTRLAGYCREAGLQMAVAQRMALFNLTLGKEVDVVRKVF